MEKYRGDLCSEVGQYKLVKKVYCAGTRQEFLYLAHTVVVPPPGSFNGLFRFVQKSFESLYKNHGKIQLKLNFKINYFKMVCFSANQKKQIKCISFNKTKIVLYLPNETECH